MTHEPDDLDVASFVANWLSHNLAVPLGDETHGDSATQLWLQLHGAPWVGWLLIGLLAASTSDPRHLARLGAGPLEDLLSQASQEFVPVVAAEARCNANIRTALSSVWLSERDLPDPLLRQLEAAAPGFARLPRPQQEPNA